MFLTEPCSFISRLAAAQLLVTKIHYNSPMVHFITCSSVYLGLPKMELPGFSPWLFWSASFQTIACALGKGALYPFYNCDINAVTLSLSSLLSGLKCNAFL